MNEHADIADLSAEPLSDAVKEHLKGCHVCTQIYTDIKLLNFELKGLSEKADIPKKADLEVYEEISLRSKEIRKILFRKNVFASVSAIAAVVILSFVIFTNVKSPTLQNADINGDGEVNVLDSFMLAQKIEETSFDKASDLNKDGSIDGRDLQLVRNAVVNLDESLP